MAYIDYLDPDRVPSADRVEDTDNILRIHGVHGRTMRLHYDLYRELMYGPGPLDRVQREMIAVAVSAANACRYWIHHHGAGLRRLLTAGKIGAERQDALLEALVDGGGSPEIGPAERAMLDYSIKLTRTPGEMSAADVDALRHAGFDDRGIHDICAIVGYFAFVNRIADGLGVELE